MSGCNVRSEALKKLAWDEDGKEYQKWLSQSAGIGTWDQNALRKGYSNGGDGWVSPHMSYDIKPEDPKSYMATLASNAMKDPRLNLYGDGTEALDDLGKVAPIKFVGRSYGEDITNGDLDDMRAEQARYAASGLAREGTPEYQAWRKALEEAGRANQKSYIETKKVPRKMPELKGVLKNIKLSPIQRKALPSIFGSMVYNKGQSSSSEKKAQAEGIWDKVRGVLDSLKKKWDGVSPENKPIVGALVGSGLGAGTGALAGKLLGFGAGTGALAGLGIGGTGGALYGAGTADRIMAAQNSSLRDELDNELGARLFLGEEGKTRSKNNALAFEGLSEKGGSKLNQAIAREMTRRRTIDDAARRTLLSSIAKEDGKAVGSDDVQQGVGEDL